MSAIDELSPASFNGVRFFVDDEETSQHRAIALHEFAGSDRWETEDQGLKAYEPRVTAYIARMEGVRGPSEALFRALMGQSGILTLPHAPPVSVWCRSVRRSHRKDKLGYVAFSCEFIQTSGAPLGLSSLLLPSQAASAWTRLVSAIAGALSGLSLSGPRVGTAFAAESVALGTSLSARVTDIADPDVLEAVVAGAGILAVSGVSAPVAASEVSPAADLAPPPDRGPPLAGAVAEIADALRLSDDPAAPQLLVDLAADIPAAAVAVAPLRAPIPDATADVVIPVAPAPVFAPRAQSRILAAQATAAFRDATRALALAAFARRLMAADYATRDEAVAARATLSALADPLLDTGELDGPTTTELGLIVGLASGHLIDQMTTLKRVIRITTGKPLTACQLAWQIYGDTTRAAELVERNRVATPCFMPTTISAVAP